MASNSDLHEVLGLSSIEKHGKENLEIRLEKNCGPGRQRFHFGQNKTTTTTPETADTYLQRDFKDIYGFEDKSKPLGLTSVPIGFIPAKPNILSLDKDVMKLSLKAENVSQENQKKLQGDRIKAVGDVAERSVYDTLKSFYGEDRKETVLFIKNLHMLQVDGTARTIANNREIDFVIVHYDLALIINIEVKNSFGLLQTQHAKVQLKENKLFIEDWFSADISDKWKYLSVLYIEQEISKADKALSDQCKPFLISGKDEMVKFLKELHDEQPKVKVPAKDFKFLAKYLLYCTSTIGLPIGKLYDQAMDIAMKKQETIENVKLWCFPTPEQKMALSKSHVLFLSTFGTGKTLLMQGKAVELAEQGEKVLYLIFHKGELCDDHTLLYIKMEHEWEHNSNITLKQMNFWDGRDNGLQKLMKPFDHVFIDEFFDDFIHLKTISKNDFIHATMGKKTLWMALSGSYNHNTYEIKKVDELPEKAKRWFPTCKLEIVQLKIPLRSPSFVPEMLKDTMESYLEIDINNVLMFNTETPPTLSEGKCSKIKIDTLDPLAEDLKKCLKEVPEGKHALIVIEDSSYFMASEHMFCKCGNSFVKKMFDGSFKQLERQPPLYWTKTDKSPLKDIQEWIGSTSKNLFLVTTYRLTFGFTHPIVINYAPLDAIARCSQHVIMPIPTPNWSLKGIPLVYHCESHIGTNMKHCRRIPDLKAPLQVIDEIIAYEGIGLKRSEVFYDYMDDHNPLMSALYDLIKKDPKLDNFIKTQVHIQQLICYARHNLDQNPTTRHVCRAFKDYDDTELAHLVMYDKMWAKHDMEEFIRMENWVLDVMAIFLKRKIVLKPLFQKSPSKRVPEGSKTHVSEGYIEKWVTVGGKRCLDLRELREVPDTYYIFGLRTHLSSFYVSAVDMRQ